MLIEYLPDIMSHWLIGTGAAACTIRYLAAVAYSIGRSRLLIAGQLVCLFVSGVVEPRRHDTPHYI